MTLDRDRVAAALQAYEVGGELGRGGWGVVLAGTHRQLGRPVAIKELPRAFAGDPTVRSRFAAEARVLAKLDHPHIVPVYDYIEEDGLCLLVMEQLPGGTVWAEFTTKGLVAERSCAVVMACCTALHFAHQAGVLHRDVKPENLMYNAQGVVKVTDFGIAKMIGGGETMATVSGDILGTPAYMAPEQAQGAQLSAATDVYAVGTMLYELLSGRLPYADDGDPLTTLYRHVHEEPTPLRDVMPSVPEPIAAVAMHAIARDPAARPPTAEQLGIELAEAATLAWGPGWLNTRSGVAVMAAGEMVAVTERPTGGTPAAAAAAPEAPPVPPAAPAPATIAPSPAPAAPTPPPPPPPLAPVRPSIAIHEAGAAINAVQDDIVPVKEIITPPGSPAGLFAGVLVALLLVLGAAFAGIGTPSYAKAGTGVLVDGKDPGASVLSLDFSNPLNVTAGGATGPLAVKVSAAGIAMASETTDASGNVDLGRARFLLSGTGSLEVSAPGTATNTFEVSSSQSPWVTAPAVVAIVALLFALAYVESLSKPLRRGRRRVGSIVGIGVLGGVLGVVLMVLAWVLGAPEISISGLVVGVVLGAAGGVLLALAELRMGQRARLRRAATRS